MTGSGLLITASPHLRARDTTPTIMWSVVCSLVPVVAVSLYYFGPSAALVIIASTFGAVLTELIFGKEGAIRDGSAAITGILLGLTLPAGLPLWMAIVGGAFGIGLGKVVFGGLGQNIFNPALLGRAFLQAAFPVAMTTWPANAVRWWSLRGDNLAFPFMSPEVVTAMTGATPLGQLKFEQLGTDYTRLMLGSTGGSLGETSAIVIVACGAYLVLRDHMNWRIPVSILITVAALSGSLHSIDPARYPGIPFMLFSGGLMLGAVYMATDMVTSPISNKGCWIFGIGIGTLVVIIRLWGGLAEGVMYSILLMNALVPFINRITQPQVFGTGKVGVRP